jgi:hypothetical protein
MPAEVTQIRIDENGNEMHESWLLLTASRVSSSPGAWLFDSEIQHNHYMVVTISRCKRHRTLNRDYKHSTNILLEMNMSFSQWAEFVSSIGDGGGASATLTMLVGEGHVPQAPPDSRLAESHREVLDAGSKALRQVQAAYDELKAAFEMGGKRAQREALVSLGHTIGNAPRNMEFAAESLTEHVENVVAKARADIEAMVEAAAEGHELPADIRLQLDAGSGER